MIARRALMTGALASLMAAPFAAASGPVRTTYETSDSHIFTAGEIQYHRFDDGLWLFDGAKCVAPDGWKVCWTRLGA